MRYIKLLTTITTIVFLGSCVKHSQGTIHSQTIVPLVVPADTLKKRQDHYPVLNLPSVTQPPSQLPPGSNLERFKNPSQLQWQALSSASQKKPAATQLSTDEQLSLIMSNNISQCWMKVECALQKTPYQIVDQDSSLSSFYIVDIKSTHDKITKATPIYRIYLKSQGNQTQVFLLNKNNQPAAKDVARRILSAIQKKVT